ncbi:BTAD domain-containing putative transcriptional regulator [Kitasatospora sp. NPDC058190]|uniref:AfsR/SARP family transcriptional regulator n=1 Tax=Kitasatospora sp. NPDC058190 TaxID=3346371 RepID=UPI0036D7A5D1
MAYVAAPDHALETTAAQAPASLDFGILGPVKATLDGQEVQLDGPKHRTVLAALLLADGRLMPDERLCTLLWGWEPPATWTAQLYTHTSRLRGRLGPGVDLVRRSSGYRLDIGAGRFDLAEFRRDAELGRQALAAGDHARAARLLRAALAHWRGAPLTGVTEHLAATELPQLAESRLAALENRIEAELELGAHATAVAELRGLVAEYPTGERLRGQLMTALYRCDRQGDALQVYDAGRRLLAEELGIDPGPTLRRLHGQILAGELPAPAARPRITVTDAAPTPEEPAGPEGAGVWAGLTPAMLPPDTVGFTGRERDLSAVLAALRGPAGGAAGLGSVVLTGAAGVGKSALAVRAAHQCRADFPDGQLYADLRTPEGGSRTPAAVLGWFLRALGVAEGALPAGLDERAQLYRSRLAGRRMLVVLDNACDDRQIRPLLTADEHNRTLVTGRSALGTVEGSRLLWLGPLDFPEAYQLLATAAPDRAVGDPSAAARIVELCDRLPLALRICAARLAAHPHWSPARLAARLDPAHRRLDELRLGDLDVRTSLRAGYQGLDPADRTAFRALALTEAAAFTPGEAAPLLGESEDGAEEILERLTEARLLTATDDGGLRYHFSSLVRLFAREQPAPLPVPC